MKLTKVWMMTFTALALWTTSAIAVPIVISDFDDGTSQGWTLNSNIPTGGFLQLLTSGGNPGGYIQFIDQGSSSALAPVMDAPSSYLGDYTSVGSSLQFEFDLKIEQAFTTNSFGPLITLSGPGGTANFTDMRTPTTAWQHYVVSINESAWTVTSGSWNALFADVTSLSVHIDVLAGLGKDSGIDNFAITSANTPIPEPSTMLLFGSGLAGLVGWQYRKNRRK